MTEEQMEKGKILESPIFGYVHKRFGGSNCFIKMIFYKGETFAFLITRQEDELI